MSDPIQYGLTGLVNTGNTCYINTCMQLLSHTSYLNDVLDKMRRPLGTVLGEWNELRKLMWKTNCTIRPDSWISAVRVASNSSWGDHYQHDAQEFLHYIIDLFHTEMKRDAVVTISASKKTKLLRDCHESIKTMYKNNYSEIMETFYGLHVSKINNSNGLISIVPEQFFVLNLAIPATIVTPTLEDCLTYFYQPEQLTGDCQYYNDKTNKKEDAIKSTSIWLLPEILVISLNRFNENGSKNTKVVTFDIDTLDMSKYVDSMVSAPRPKYALYGICNHIGSVMGGHYNAYIKPPNQEWYAFNDENVCKVSSLNLESTLHQNAYCLFYKKL